MGLQQFANSLQRKVSQSQTFFFGLALDDLIGLISPHWHFDSANSFTGIGPSSKHDLLPDRDVLRSLDEEGGDDEVGGDDGEKWDEQALVDEEGVVDA